MNILNALTESSFDWADEHFELPVLVLAIDWQRDHPSQPYNFTDALEWQLLRHQTAGHGCHQQFFFGARLEPRPDILQLMHDIDDRYYDSQIGLFGFPALDDALEYRKMLRPYDLDCNASYTQMEEAIYPVDARFAARASSTPLPDNLDDLIEWEDELDRTFGLIGRWTIYILGENSD